MMERITVQETKKIELNILISIREFCKENGIRYYLTGGSLIGAVRHSGFIPWDDDIDIIMPRKDYMHFIEIFPQEGLNGYKLLSPYTENDCCIVFSKVYDPHTVKMDKEVEKKYWKYGVDVDIFPTDGVPEREKDKQQFFKQQYKDFHIFLALVGGFCFSGNLLKVVAKYIFTMIIKFMGKLGIINANRICLRINDRARQYDVDECQEIAMSIFPHYGKREITNRDRFLRQVELPFENELFTAPGNYDEFLTSLYGDYMKLPPIDKQKTHHLSDFYRK